MKFSKSKDNTPTSSRESSLNRLPLDLLNDNGNPNPNTNTVDINSDYSFPNDVNVQGTSDHPLGDTILDTMTHSKAKATSEDIINNISDSSLKTAAEMFLFLNSCPKDFKSWFLFYEDLFQNDPLLLL